MATMRLMYKLLLSYFPTQLPVGLTEFNEFANDIIELSGRYADDLSMRFAIASMLIHAPHDKGSLSKRYFVVRLRKSAANQIASQVFQDVKAEQEKQKAASEAAQLKQVEATAAEIPASGEKSS